MDPYTGDKFNCETGDAIPATRSRAAARPTFLKRVAGGICRACFSASFAALGFFCVFCLEDMPLIFSKYIFFQCEKNR